MLKILLPTDFSENSKNAITFALKFYEEVQVEFCLLHSQMHLASTKDFDLKGENRPRGNDRGQKEVFNKLEGLEAALKVQFKNEKHTFKIKVGKNSLTKEIKNILLEEKADMIVMGTQGANSAKAVFVGTRTTQVLRVATCPVFIVPSVCRFDKPKNVAFVTDFKRNFSADILAPLIRVVDLFRPSLRVMHITEKDSLGTVQQSNRNTLEAYLAKFMPSWHWMPHFANKTKGIKVFLDELNIDLLIMVRYRHDYLELLLREPVIKKIGFSITVPFLVIPFEN